MQYIASKDTLILDFLHELFPDSSFNTLRSWIRAGRVSMNGNAVVKANEPIAAGATLSVGPKVGFLRRGVKVLFEDQELIVLEKPEGLLSVATDFDQTTSLHCILKRRFHKQRVFPVHRLDRETSGVMVFAYTDFSRKRLKEQFERHHIEKTYYAIVEGKPSVLQGTWESYLEEDPFYSVSSTLEPGAGKLAITHYEAASENKEATLLVLRPVTGKKHQLRVHCKEAGIPILGDKRYGTGKDPLKRLCLHAKTLVFTHPVTEKKMKFEVALPASFNKLFPKFILK